MEIFANENYFCDLQNTFANTFVFALADTRDDQSTVDD
jgi:hypothetical protein